MRCGLLMIRFVMPLEIKSIRTGAMWEVPGTVYAGGTYVGGAGCLCRELMLEAPEILKRKRSYGIIHTGE